MSYNYKKLCKFFRDLEEFQHAGPNASGAEGYIEEVALYYWYTYGKQGCPDFIWAIWYAIRLLIKNGFRPVTEYDVKQMRDENVYMFSTCYDWDLYFDEDSEEENDDKQMNYICNLTNSMLNGSFRAWAYNDMYKDEYVPYSFCSERRFI